MTDQRYRSFSNAVADLARIAAKMDDPKRNVLGVTSEQLEHAKTKVEQTLRRIVEKP